MTASARNLRHLRLEEIGYRGRHLWTRCTCDGHPFSTAVWYSDVDLEALARSVGRDAAERVYFHVAAFQLNTLCSLMPDTLSFGPYATYVTPRFLETWTAVLVNVWAQWRYEHDLPDWRGPDIIDTTAVSPETRVPPDWHRHAGPDAEPRTLLFFGGGKDSLVAARLLQHAEVPWSSLAYAHSIYGPPDPQHALIDTVLDRVASPVGPTVRHRQWMSDEAFTAPLPPLLPEAGVTSILAAETPSSIFAALPVALTHGYRHAALAHEHSANRGNLIWDRTGEDVNHQWGKSWAAESLLAEYVSLELVPGFRWFSILQPLSDVLIFELLRDAGPAVLATHSCNVRKPWCMRCAKCAYVALGYAAHLPDGIYESVFAEDVLDLPENEPFFRQMIGLGSHTPFECIGEVEEGRLALALAAARGRQSRAVDIFRREFGRIDVEATLTRYAVVHERAPHGIPPDLAARVLPVMRAAAKSAQERIRTLLARSG